MNEKKLARLQVQDLLDVCQECELKDLDDKDGVCYECPTYEKLRILGDTLKGKSPPKKVPEEGKDVPGSKLSVEEYFKLKSQGLKDKEIRDLKGLTAKQMYNWKHLRKEKLKEVEEKMTKANQEILTETKAETKTETDEWKKKYDELAEKLKALESDFIKTKKDKTDLKDELSMTKEKLVSTAAKLNSARLNCDEALNALREKEYELENQRDHIKRLKVENQAMRELLRLWI